MGNVSYRTWEKEQVGDDADDYGARSKNVLSGSSQDSISECACALAGGSRDPVVYIRPRNATLRLAVCWLRISTPPPPARPDPPWTFLSPSPCFWTSSRANSSSRSWWCAPPCLHGPSCCTATTATFFNEIWGYYISTIIQLRRRSSKLVTLGFIHMTWLLVWLGLATNNPDDG